MAQKHKEFAPLHGVIAEEQEPIRMEAAGAATPRDMLSAPRGEGGWHFLRGKDKGQ